MTTKEAAEKFGISNKTVSKLCSENKIHGVEKINGKYRIPDETEMIITDDAAKAFLIQVLKLKNNPDITLPVAGYETEEKKKVWYGYLLNQGLIGECALCADAGQWMQGMSLTDKGLETILGKKNAWMQLQAVLKVSGSLNIGIVNIG
ncbi:MAG: helix-turn-helix domain-containing protein [Clostridia bacterium]|nr:helix-turn-helix domain-containing protein [Clostridia bacterium]